LPVFFEMACASAEATERMNTVRGQNAFLVVAGKV